MNELEYVPVPAFEDNYIWLVSDGRDAIAVDPGEAAPVRRVLAERGWRLTAILLTHHHADHVGGVDALLHSQPADTPLTVYGPAAEAIDVVTRPLSGGDRVTLDAPAVAFDVLDVPGHTRGHIAYFQAAGQGAASQGAAGHGNAVPHVFCGDTLFSCGCGRLFEGTPAQMLASLDALAALPDDTRVHCAHEYTLSNIRFALACEPGNAALAAWRDDAQALRARGVPTLPTTIAHERAVNPFMRADSAAIHATLEAELHETVTDRLAAFTLMREWKNRFR
ncbi:hydroxyacylglutathione hydrolase [Burkholderia cenocepacia]|jgi:hydroxyacylglutathione hydrolase|uniref:hydroxyacylglutathione hydrolase n=1 Tax=Burkholderia cenocepacia TaxID=95486 RepID=UPI0004F671E2|nr:hydroxyacylglutathione hydrolase [Burkholderia cenocepacia]AIO48133.1 hydroxyacylglutathione hydrolase [Burkholderia cepacia]KGB96052.1 hydroxyacylglutathione hydrolase [Burkholderia cepacia]MCG0582989.1 hydroxyacylglutathione hydrolase [Burkholderia cenocepacia]MCW3524067.1 hydroxyacylglutathione hydrolase [Burkholderia cenocepacia]MCW3614289.1 hydroxyacylglutathione hydrolase [Burkholderia cenocepacia]